MNLKARNIARAALIAALYVVLTHLQNIIFPNSANFVIQCRLSEALCVLTLFTPAAISGLTIGCLVFNITFAAALPLDWLVGAAATLCATCAMRALRNLRIMGYPLPAMLMPAFFNALLVGWELTVYIGSGFWLNALYVALGELIALLLPGSLLLHIFEKRGLSRALFHGNE